MATIYSDQLVKVRAGRNITPADWHGKVRPIKWDFASLPAGNIGDILVCGRIQANEMVLIGNELHTAAGAGTFHIGLYEILANGDLGAVFDVDAFLVSASGGVGQNLLANLQAQVIGAGPLFIAPRDLYVCITNIGTAFTTAARFAGYLLVVGD